MQKNWRTSFKQILILAATITTLLLTANQIRTQTPLTTTSIAQSFQTTTLAPSGEPSTISRSKSDDDCEKNLGIANQRLAKTLDALTALQAHSADQDRQIANANDIIVKQDAYNVQLLQVVKMLVSAEKRDKSFFRKLVDGLQKVLEAATDPKTLIEIAAIIVIARNLSK